MTSKKYQLAAYRLVPPLLYFSTNAIRFERPQMQFLQQSQAHATAHSPSFLALRQSLLRRLPRNHPHICVF